MWDSAVFFLFKVSQIVYISLFLLFLYIVVFLLDIKEEEF